MDVPWILLEHNNMHRLVNTWDHTISGLIQNIPSNHPRWKLLDTILQQKIPDSDEENHIERNEPISPLPQPRWTCCTGIFRIYNFFLFIIAEFMYVLIYLVPNLPSCAIVKDPFTRHLTTVNTCLYVLCQYYTYSRIRGSVGYTHQGSIYFLARFHLENLKRYS